ncbi:FimD/PapC C-terminal domain-containing protein [Morganella morganii]|uniref:FimD/PapC C-terminal domain-containing protein n=1 Tax=Morganella morganii TaxID=582 RepID=UPI0032DA423A
MCIHLNLMIFTKIIRGFISTRQEFYLHAVRQNGRPLPFGTEVTDGNNNSIGYVGQNSLLYIRSETRPEQINVRLTDTDSGYCRITLTPDPQSEPLPCAE